MRQLIAWGGLLALVVLHLDFWRGPRPGTVFGWLPEDMAYRLAWMAAAAIYLLYFTYRVWDGDEAEDQAGDGDGDGGPGGGAGR